MFCTVAAVLKLGMRSRTFQLGTRSQLGSWPAILHPHRTPPQLPLRPRERCVLPATARVQPLAVDADGATVVFNASAAAGRHSGEPHRHHRAGKNRVHAPAVSLPGSLRRAHILRAVQAQPKWRRQARTVRASGASVPPMRPSGAAWPVAAAVDSAVAAAPLPSREHVVRGAAFRLPHGDDGCMPPFEPAAREGDSPRGSAAPTGRRAVKEACPER